MPFDMPNFDPAGDFAFGGGELMGLGMSEALPPFEVLEELYDHHPVRALKAHLTCSETTSSSKSRTTSSRLCTRDATIRCSTAMPYVNRHSVFNMPYGPWGHICTLNTASMPRFSTEELATMPMPMR